MISSKMENVLSISHLKQYIEEYPFLISIPISPLTVNYSDLIPLPLDVSITITE
jgi:hypothetical protein